MTTGGQTEHLKYKRSRFTARLPLDRYYTPSHFWIKQVEDGPADQALHRVGFTRFAKRLLGDIVEHDFEVEADSAVELGQIIGWVEAFKAVSDIYCVVEGTFLGPNPAIAQQPELIDKDPHGEGWLYSVRGRPDPESMDAHGYSDVLDANIDRMLGERDQQYGDEDE